MRHSRRGRGMGAEFGGSGEDSFVAVVVTKLTGALLFVLLLTMVIMALIPRADVPGKAADDPLSIVTDALPDAVAGRPYAVTLAARGGSGHLSWGVVGNLPEGFAFDSVSGRLSGTPQHATDPPRTIEVQARDGSGAASRSLSLTILEPDRSLGTAESRPALVMPSWRDWVSAGFGYIILAALWIAGLGVVGSVERWSRRQEKSTSRVTSLRFVGYRLLVTLVSLGAGFALWFWGHA